MSRSAHAERASDLVHHLQTVLASRLQELDPAHPFTTVHWQRNQGRNGGGHRRVAPEGGLYNRASVNVSVIHYDDQPDKPLASATALSAIVHPAPPLAPSMHLHVSWTELKDGRGSWRVMADLNPSLPIEADTAAFRQALRSAAPDVYPAAAAQGDRYFFIPALDRHRGVAHFYLESYATDDAAADLSLARDVALAAIRTYADLVARRMQGTATPEQVAAQRAYHTLYLFQVLTLDRGTTSGLMVHDQNDAGIMGSLPARVDADLLRSWASRVPDLQVPLVHALADVLGPGHDVAVDASQKLRLAQAVREYYRDHPQALALQARGDVLPPTVANHGGPTP